MQDPSQYRASLSRYVDSGYETVLSLSWEPHTWTDYLNIETPPENKQLTSIHLLLLGPEAAGILSLVASVPIRPSVCPYGQTYPHDNSGNIFQIF